MTKTMNQPCYKCERGDHIFCIANFNSRFCTCQDEACLMRKYNKAVRNVVSQAERLGLFVRLGEHPDHYPQLYDDALVNLIIHDGPAF